MVWHAVNGSAEPCRGAFTGFASAADLKTVIGFLDSWMNSGFGVIEFEVPWSSLLESLVSFWRTLN